MSKLLISFWFLISILLFVYSYGFVDLNLTLSSHPIVFDFVSKMQGLVYFDRTLSLTVFVTLILSLFVLYTATLLPRHARFPWKIVIVLSLILALAYPMLSSDIFKYLFGAKQIMVYHTSPYLVTPDTYSSDTWIRFMRWVHTTSPYGPVFVGLTIPYYLLGMGKFVPILYLFKLDQIAWYLLTIWVIGRLTRSPRAQLYFALNPLILMEWLVNAHNDAIMISLLLLALYLSQIKKKVWSIVTLALSVGIKYVTVFALPLLFVPKKYFLLALKCLLVALAITPLLYNYSWQYQPWYVTWLVPLAALIPNRLIRVTVAAYSFSVFSRYLYFVGAGSWLGTPIEHALMTFALPALALLTGLARQVLRSR